MGENEPCGWGPLQAIWSGEAVDEALLQLQEASHSQALILMWGFNHPDISWERNTAAQENKKKTFRSMYETKQSRSITGPGAHSTDKLIRGIRTGGSLGCRDRVQAEFLISRNTNLTTSKSWISEEWTHSCLKKWMDEISWETLLRASRGDQSWPYFRTTFLRSTRSLHPGT